MTISFKGDAFRALPPLLKEADLAIVLSIPLSRVQQWRRSGRLGPFVRAGSLSMMRRDAFERWLIEREG